MLYCCRKKQATKQNKTKQNKRGLWLFAQRKSYFAIINPYISLSLLMI